MSTERLSLEKQEELWNSGVRVSTIIHIHGALSDFEAPSDPMREFLDDVAHEAKFEAQWPGYEARMKMYQDTFEEIRKEEDRRSADDYYIGEVGSFYARECPHSLLVLMEIQLDECVRPDPSGECLGTWRGGWGHYQLRWILTDSITDAIEQALAQQRERRRKSWQDALDRQNEKAKS